MGERREERSVFSDDGPGRAMMVVVGMLEL
jgi:hypothetical protein